MDPARVPEGIPVEYLLEVYWRSARSGLARLRQLLEGLPESPNEAGLAEVRRLAHNLKGSSRQLGFDPLGRRAAAVEHRADALLRRAPAEGISPAACRRLARSVASLAECLEETAKETS